MRETGFPFHIEESPGEVKTREKSPCTLADLETQDFFVYPQDKGQGHTIQDSAICMVMADLGKRVSIWNFASGSRCNVYRKTHPYVIPFCTESTILLFF